MYSRNRFASRQNRFSVIFWIIFILAAIAVVGYIVAIGTAVFTVVNNPDAVGHAIGEFGGSVMKGFNEVSGQ